MNFFQKFSADNAPKFKINKPDPTFAVLTTLIFITGVSATPPGIWWAYAVNAVLVITAGAATRVGFRYLLKRGALILPFSLAVVPTIFTKPGNVIWETEIASFWTLSISDFGVVFVSSVILKAFISSMAAAVLIKSVPLNEILSVMRRFKTPAIIIAITESTYRYIHLMMEEVRRMMNAKKSRSASIKGVSSGGNLYWRAAVLGNMVGIFFLRSLDRAERVHAAMLSRGYDYLSNPISERNGKAVGRETVLLILVVGAAIVCITVLAYVL